MKQQPLFLVLPVLFPRCPLQIFEGKHVCPLSLFQTRVNILVPSTVPPYNVALGDPSYSYYFVHPPMNELCFLHVIFQVLIPNGTSDMGRMTFTSFVAYCCCCLVAKSYLFQVPLFHDPMNSVGHHFLLQGIVPNQASNLRLLWLLHW